MKIFDMFKKNEDSQAVAQAKAYYAQLISPEYQKYFRIEDAGEGMSLAEEVIMQYWKPRYLMDNNTKCAYELLNVNEKFVTVTTDDIDWDSLKGLPEEAIQRARDLNAHYPTRVRNFENGVAQVSWQLNPDGMSFMDEDGFGMTNDDEVVPPATNGAAYYNSMRKAGNRCAMFCYPTGGHGFGFRSSWRYHDLMLMELSQWLTDLQMPSANAVKVACVGNSITDGAGIDMADVKGYPAELGRLMGEGYTVKNFGVSGRTMANSGNRPYQKELSWRDCLDWNPDVVVIKLGTNDTKTVNWEGKAENDFIPSLQQMIDSLNARPKAPRVVLCTPIPAFQEEWTIRDSIIVSGVIPRLTQYAADHNLELVDLYTPFRTADKQGWMTSDLIHPNAKGAKEMAKIISEQLRMDPPAPVKSKKGKRKK